MRRIIPMNEAPTVSRLKIGNTAKFKAGMSCIPRLAEVLPSKALAELESQSNFQDRAYQGNWPVRPMQDTRKVTGVTPTCSFPASASVPRSALFCDDRLWL
jgi:hypothetical protein